MGKANKAFIIKKLIGSAEHWARICQDTRLHKYVFLIRILDRNL
jgi:hypothetical protein